MHAHRFTRSALLGSSVLVLVLLPAAVARADSYGEIQPRIGSKEPGTANGQFSSERTRLLGVDPTDNSVYVLDEPERYSQEKREVIDPETKTCVINEVTGKCELEGFGPVTRHFRIQKFTAGKSGYAFSASVSFDQVSPESEFYENGFLQAGVEGIAIDPELHRLYVLTADNREAGLTVDDKYGTSGQGIVAASTLYAFSTKEEAGKLVPAAGTKEGVLTGPGGGGFEAQSSTPGKALLQPAGITVDAKTHDIIVLGHIDEKGEATDNITNSGDHYVLQRISSNGELGPRYVDKTGFFKSEAPETLPDSPAVAAITAGNERVYVNFDGLVEVPYEFTSEASPHRVSTRLVAPLGNGIASGPKAGFQKETEAISGGALVAAVNGTLYAMGDIKTEELGVGTDHRVGVLAFSGNDGSELGWSGGQTPLLEGAKDKCATQPELAQFPELPLRIAAGSEEKVFVLNTEFLKRWEGEEAQTLEEEEERAIEGEKTKGPFFPAVIELGPGGSGCPHAGGEELAAEANGKPLTEAQSIPAGSSVKLSAFLKQGDALSVEWEFGSGGEKQTVSGDELQMVSVTHKFGHEGLFAIRATIRTDNLATPSVTLEWPEKIKVTGSPPPERPIVEGPASALVGQVVTFSDPQSGGIAKYKWNFGDGVKEETVVPHASHAYAHSCGCKVELVVANAEGKESEPGSKLVTVTEPEVHKEESKPEEHKEEPKPEEHKGSGGTLAYAVSVASTTLTVSPSGSFAIKIDCAGTSACSGTITLKTLTAVVTSHKHKAILTLGSGSFSLTAGQVKSVTLHLSVKARALLAHAHVLRARVTIAGHDSEGKPHTTVLTVTLKPARRHH